MIYIYSILKSFSHPNHIDRTFFISGGLSFILPNYEETKINETLGINILSKNQFFKRN